MLSRVNGPGLDDKKSGQMVRNPKSQNGEEADLREANFQPRMDANRRELKTSESFESAYFLKVIGQEKLDKISIFLFVS